MCGFCNLWVCVCVGVLVICVLVFTVFCIVSFMYIYSLYAFVLFYKLFVFIVMFMYSFCYVCSVLYILFSSCQLALFGYPD